MQLKAAFVVITSVLLFLIFIQVIKILPTKSPSTNSSTSNDHVSHDTWSCFSQKMSFDHGKILLLNSMLINLISIL